MLGFFMVFLCMGFSKAHQQRKKEHILVLRRKEGKSKKEGQILDSECKNKEEVELNLVVPALRAWPVMLMTLYTLWLCIL